jgi:hypothetical protein
MPDFIGFTVAQVDDFLNGNPATTPGLDRHYTIVPPPDANGPATPNDKVASQNPAAGRCSDTALNSTLYLVLP